MPRNFKNKKAKSILLYIIISFLIISVVLIVSIGISLANENNKKKILDNPNIYNNIYISDINVSNLSKEEANKVLEQLQINEKITLNYKDKQYIFNKIDFGVKLNKEQAVLEAYNVGRIGSEKERIKEIKSLENKSKNINISKIIEEDTIKNKISEIAKDINAKPKNATLKKTEEGFNVIDGSNGVEVNIDATYTNLEDALKLDGDTSAEIVVNELSPKYTSQDLSKVQDKLGTFTTKYSNRGGSDGNRIINMKVAAEKVNGTILYPGEVFSTNKTFGAATPQNGYKPAPTILDGKFVDDYGGGVCQISSTLYNAILYSEVDILERQNHSLKVGYLDYGYDATLAGDYIDFKFKNTTNYPIYLESYLTDNEVICNVYGYDERPDNRKIKFENALVEVIEPGPEIIKETDELLEGETKVSIKESDGYKYKLYKLVYIDGKLTEKVLVNNSYYRPRAKETLIGTKKTKEVSSTKDKPINNLDNKVNREASSNKKTAVMSETITETTTQIITDPIIEQTTEIITENTIEYTSQVDTEIIDEITVE